MSDKTTPRLVSPIFQGCAESASYLDPQIPDYRGNPLIEALPAIWTRDEVARHLMYYPEYDEGQRIWPAELRFHLIRNAVRFFEPLPVHLDLEQRFSCMIRMGYQGRNPVERGFWSGVDEQVASVGQNRSQARRRHSRSTALGFAIIGISGIGKTTAVEAILSLYPQVIYHSQYQKRDFNRVQVVWLKLDCPFDGSVKGLCLNFFQAIDGLLDTEYYLHYARRGRASVDEMLPQMTRVASIHGLGLLVIDELQHLSEAKSGGSSRMLNFFVQMVNTIGMPVVLIGTYKAIPLLRGEFRQARRGTGQGDLIWDRMKNDHLWRYFLESLWRYQYVRNASPLTDQLSDACYAVTQGITDFAVKVYMLAQIRSIATGMERVTESLIHSVAADSLCLAAPVLEALRRGDSIALHTVEDVYIDLDRLVMREIEAGASTILIRSSSFDDEEGRDASLDPSTEGSQPATQKAPAGKPPLRKRRTADPQSGLLEVVARGAQTKVSAYETINQAGYIRSVSEFLNLEVQT